jgi:D-cysteine desulfhydrase family pyridoxal phosphate-dependent enzyme
MTELVERLREFPRTVLMRGATPIEAAPRLGAALGIDLLLKRDDDTGLAFGGNKVRQLEFYFGQAEAEGADTVLITGAVQSNYVRVAAAAAAKLGFLAHVQLERRVPGMDETYYSSGNVLLNDLLGAVRHDYPVGEDEEGADRALQELAAELRSSGSRPYVIPLGPGNPPTGSLGYVAAAIELVEQMPDLSERLGAIVVASGSAMTHSGLLFGLRALGQRVPVLGICVRRAAELQQGRVEQKCAELGEMLGMPGVVVDGDVQVFDETLAPGYGQLNDEVFEAISMTARLEGVLLDPTYTGRTMAGLIALVRGGGIEAGSTVMFIHTGGTPAVFAYETELRARLDAAKG